MAQSHFILAISSNASLIIVIINTNERGAINVNKNPTHKAFKNYERAINKKKRLKKNLN